MKKLALAVLLVLAMSASVFAGDIAVTTKLEGQVTFTPYKITTKLNDVNTTNFKISAKGGDMAKGDGWDAFANVTGSSGAMVYGKYRLQIASGKLKSDIWGNAQTTSEKRSGVFNWIWGKTTAPAADYKARLTYDAGIAALTYDYDNSNAGGTLFVDKTIAGFAATAAWYNTNGIAPASNVLGGYVSGKVAKVFDVMGEAAFKAGDDAAKLGARVIYTPGIANLKATVKVSTEGKNSNNYVATNKDESLVDVQVEQNNPLSDLILDVANKGSVDDAKDLADSAAFKSNTITATARFRGSNDQGFGDVFKTSLTSGKPYYIKNKTWAAQGIVTLTSDTSVNRGTKLQLDGTMALIPGKAWAVGQVVIDSDKDGGKKVTQKTMSDVTVDMGDATTASSTTITAKGYYQYTSKINIQPEVTIKSAAGKSYMMAGATAQWFNTADQTTNVGAFVDSGVKAADGTKVSSNKLTVGYSWLF